MKNYLINCINCGKQHISAADSYHKFCSNRCQAEYGFKKNIQGWFDGKIIPLNTNGIAKPFVRKYLFRKYNNKCCTCGWREINKTTGKIPLEVDHIDGNYKNNDLSNLRLLCPNCHSLSSNYKNLNKGNGRGKRKS
jgi:endogenous inhibitor of DNA gyrase (YacG/DUF329 family)